jgi:AcrR family transcriptional regulator
MGSIDEPTNARSRRTRDALLDGARGIIESEGFGSITMAAVAERAGVSRRAAYLHFDNLADLLGALFDHIAITEGLQESVASVWEAPDARSALRRWADHLADYHPRLMNVDRAITAVQEHDPAAAAHRARVDAKQRESCARIVRWIDDEQRLADGWTVETATDMLFGLISTDLIERLLRTREWDQQQLADGLARLFLHGLTSDG